MVSNANPTNNSSPSHHHTIHRPPPFKPPPKLPSLQPKVYQVQPIHFRELVQRLTGKPPQTQKVAPPAAAAAATTTQCLKEVPSKIETENDKMYATLFDKSVGPDPVEIQCDPDRVPVPWVSKRVSPPPPPTTTTRCFKEARTSAGSGEDNMYAALRIPPSREAVSEGKKRVALTPLEIQGDPDRIPPWPESQVAAGNGEAAELSLSPGFQAWFSFAGLSPGGASEQRAFVL